MIVPDYNAGTQSVFLVVRAYHFLIDNSLQFAVKDQQESRAVAEKPHYTIVKFDLYQNLQWRRAVLPAIAWPVVLIW